MILLYYAPNSLSCRKSFAWFQYHNIEVLQKRIEYITQNDLVHALSLTERGFKDILKRGDLSTLELQVKIENIWSMSFNEGIEFILKNPDVLKVPLIIGEQKLLAGHDSEKIRTFIPRNIRNLELKIER